MQPSFLMDISLCLMVSFTLCMCCPDFFQEDMKVGPNLITAFGLITSKSTLSKHRCLCLQYIILTKVWKQYSHSGNETLHLKFFPRLAILSHDTGDWQGIISWPDKQSGALTEAPWNAAVPFISFLLPHFFFFLCFSPYFFPVPLHCVTVFLPLSGELKTSSLSFSYSACCRASCAMLDKPLKN